METESVQCVLKTEKVSLIYWAKRSYARILHEGSSEVPALTPECRSEIMRAMQCMRGVGAEAKQEKIQVQCQAEKLLGAQVQHWPGIWAKGGC